MAYFDKDNFRKEAEAANYSKEAIDAYIAKMDAQDTAEKHATVTRMLAPTAASASAVVAPPEPVAASVPVAAAPAASVVPSAPAVVSVPTVPAGTTAADLFTGKTVPSGMGTPPEERVGQVGQNVVDAGGNLVQNAVDYFSTFPNYHPNITGAALAVPIAYAAHKAAQATGLYDTLVSKMATNNASAQPQPFVGGSGPRVTPPATAPAITPAATPIQTWDIHGDPSFGGFFGDGTAPVDTAAPAAAPVNTKLQELQARAAAGTPATNEFVGPQQPVGPPEFTGPRRPVTPTPPAALTSTTTPTTEPVPPTGYNKRVTEAMAGVPKSVQDQLAKEGKVALKGYGAGDINLTNTYGMNAYQTLVDHFNDGKPIGSYDNYLEVNKKIQKGIPSSLAPEFAAKLPGSEAEAGNFGKAFGETGAYTKEGKIVTSPNAIKNAIKGGGAMILATAIPNLANAATNAAQGKYGEAGGQAAEVGMNFMPPALQALTYAKGAGEGEDTELARQRRMTEYVKRAGRGVAQGYDPRKLIGVAPPAR